MAIYCFINRTSHPKNSQKVGRVVSTEDLFVLKNRPEDDLIQCCDIALFFVGSVIQSHVGCMQHPLDRLMSHFPAPLQRQS